MADTNPTAPEHDIDVLLAAARFAGHAVWTAPNVSLPEAYGIVRAMGFEGIEHSFPYDHPAETIAGLLRDNDLEMICTYSPCRYAEGEKGFACVPGREDEFARTIHAGLDYGRVVGSKMMGVLVGEIPSGVSRDTCIDVLTGNLRRASEAAANAGVTIIIEPICRDRIPDFAIYTMEQGAELMGKVARGNVTLCLDTFHVAMESGTVIDKFDAYWDLIGHIQICNAPGRNGPGEGELDLGYITRDVLRRGWRSWISCEYTPDGPPMSASAMDWRRRLSA